MTPVPLHSPLRLAGQVRVNQGAACGSASARWYHPGWRTITPRNHGELVRPGGGSIVQIGGAAGLEGSTLALGGSGVGRGQVGVVVSAAQGHGGGGRGGVGEGGRVVHSGTGETTL